MKTKLNYTLMLLSLIFTITVALVSCKKEGILNAFSTPVELGNATPLEGDELGVYTAFFDGRIQNGNVKIKLTQNGDNYTGGINAWYYEDTTAPQISDGGNFFINDIPLKFNGNIYEPEGVAAQDLSDFVKNDLLGKDVVFKHQKDGLQTFEESIYLPKDIHISNLESSKIPNTNYYKVDRNNFVISCNEDVNNDNGILVLISYTGEFLDMTFDDLQDQEPIQIFRATHIYDDASTIQVPAELFEDIPNGAIVTLWVTRGNVKVIDDGDTNFLLRGLTEQKIRVVL